MGAVACRTEPAPRGAGQQRQNCRIGRSAAPDSKRRRSPPSRTLQAVAATSQARPASVSKTSISRSPLVASCPGDQVGSEESIGEPLRRQEPIAAARPSPGRRRRTACSGPRRDSSRALLPWPSARPRCDPAGSARTARNRPRPGRGCGHAGCRREYPRTPARRQRPGPRRSGETHRRDCAHGDCSPSPGGEPTARSKTSATARPAATPETTGAPMLLPIQLSASAEGIENAGVIPRVWGWRRILGRARGRRVPKSAEIKAVAVFEVAHPLASSP